VDVLVDSAIVWSSTADITSGTQTILVPAQDVDGATAVRVTLASDGASSPILESVEYVYEDSSTPPVSQTFLVDFTYRVEGDTVRFLDLTRNVSGLGLSYRWQFGDGAESFVREAWHVYPPTIWGTYAVTLTVCDPFVCKSASRNVTIVQWDIVMLVVIVAAIAFTYAWVRKTERRERRARVSGRRE
jgi:PKD repeat protein